MLEIFKKKPNLHDEAVVVAGKVAEIAQAQLEDNLINVVHYGSTAYGRPTKASDIDILVVVKKTGNDLIEPSLIKLGLLEAAQLAGLPQGLLHLGVITKEEFAAYPPVHPAIFAAFMRGRWLLPEE